MWRALVGPRLDGKLSMLPSFAAAMSFYFLVMNEMARGIHFICSDQVRPSPGGFRRRLKSLGLLLIWVLAMLAAALLIVVMPLLQAELVRLGAGRFVPERWTLVRYPAALLLTFGAFWMTYRLVPERRITLWASGGGALVASLVWTLTCLLFAFLLPMVWHRSLFQGALSSALAILIWAHCGAWGVLLGACWTARFDL